MSQLLKILGVALAVFIVVAIVQEREFFYESWFGGTEVPLEPSEQDRADAGRAVYLMLTIMGHLYSSGGDARFAERMPASDAVIEEMLEDIEYLSANHRRQDPELKQLEIRSVEALTPDRLELRTRELWSFRFLWLDGGRASDPPRIEVLHSRYLVVRTQSGWRVEGWRFDDPPEDDAEAGAS